jgi:hypothetical protein
MESGGKLDSAPMPMTVHTSCIAVKRQGQAGESDPFQRSA